MTNDGRPRGAHRLQLQGGEGWLDGALKDARSDTRGQRAVVRVAPEALLNEGAEAGRGPDARVWEAAAEAEPWAIEQTDRL